MISNVNKKNFSTTETILQQLRNDINNLHYNDQFITEAEVSSRFQVSRTPAREALNILCHEGIRFRQWKMFFIDSEEIL